jgi:hypothetical protein
VCDIQTRQEKAGCEYEEQADGRALDDFRRHVMKSVLSDFQTRAEFTDWHKRPRQGKGIEFRPRERRLN